MSFLCSLPLIASLISSCPAEAPVAVGYVEGEYVLLAPLENAQVRSIAVRRGDVVEQGQELAAMGTPTPSSRSTRRRRHWRKPRRSSPTSSSASARRRSRCWKPRCARPRRRPTRPAA
jgi:hypothetical protein